MTSYPKISPAVINFGQKTVDFFNNFPLDGKLDDWAAAGQEIENMAYIVNNSSRFSVADRLYMRALSEYSMATIFIHLPHRFEEIMNWSRLPADTIPELTKEEVSAKIDELTATIN